jgi:hypothetical protein
LSAFALWFCGFFPACFFFGWVDQKPFVFSRPQKNKRQDAIIDGDRIEAGRHASTGALVISGGGQQHLFCTGTLIAPDVVLTAAHCVEAIPEMRANGYSTHFVLTDDVRSGVNESESIFIEYEAHPDYVTDFVLPASRMPVCNVPKDGLDEQLCSDLKVCNGTNGQDMHTCLNNYWWDYVHTCTGERSKSFGECEDEFYFSVGMKGLSDGADIALVYLRYPIHTVTPSKVLQASDSEKLEANTPVTIVGYGQQSPEAGAPDSGYKVEAESLLTEVGYGEIKVGNDPSLPQQCFGDSGGPTFLNTGDKNPVVIGVTSRGYDWGDCNQGGIETRTDIFFSWLDERMKSACESGKRTSCVRGGTLVPELDIYINTPTPMSVNEMDSGCSSIQASQNMLPVWMVLMIGMLSRLRKKKVLVPVPVRR